jgi:probable phosphoglycerate mutase
LILVRHGATLANVCQPYVLQGLSPDPDLVELGWQQARAVATASRTSGATHVYCSPLLRAAQTAQAIADELRVPVTVVPPLVEADTGLWTGLSWPAIEQRWPAEHAAFVQDPEQHPYLGGENLAQVHGRCVPAALDLVARHPGEVFVVVGHGVVNRVLLAHWLELPLRFARRLPQNNGGINIITFEGSKSKVRTVNALGHLPGRPEG